MSAEEILKESERSATYNTDEQFVSRVAGKTAGKKHYKSWGALGVIALMAVVAAVLMSFGNFIPAAISERLIEATDVQYADAVESKILVFQQALEGGDIPSNTVKRLEGQGVEVNGSTLTFKGETITAGNFIDKVHSNAAFYNAFTAATYDRAAYFYDEPAEEVFRKIGTTRNNYSKSSEFDAVMSRLVGEGSDVNVSNVGLVEKENEKGEKYEEYEVIGETGHSGSSAEGFVKTVAENNIDEDEFSATMNATTAINNADIITKEQKSAIFFMAFMENISKMKAGDGNESKINEAMNYLFKQRESSITDVKTGETITTKGSMLESPSLYAILAGEKIDVNKVTNYASDRVLKSVENRVGTGNVSNEYREENVTSTGTKTRGTIGRFLWGGEETASFDAMANTVPIVNESMVDNGFDTIGGIYGGELLVEGAVNVGKMLAKASGGTAGDGDAVKSYARLGNEIAALDKEADRLNKSPFDITSSNTFHGSIFHKFGSVFKNGIFSLFSSASAEDEGTLYLSNFGTDCETIGSVGAVGSAACSEIATFDTSTLDDPFNNSEFMAFVEENTEYENGKRTVKPDSDLANFIKYNNERMTPIGAMDGGILEALTGGSSSIPFISDIISMIKTWLGASDEDKAIATGKVFVNSSSNPDWAKYKYAQRYVSLARATDALRQYDGDETAYNNIKYFEGSENPVVAFLNDYYASL
ncbi:hypothetical protein IJG92_03475 [Candidatus Saccharibacteria bacterium]|nr:hypothetical protein [Candidatus Saccharibacteria bacterium]